MESAVSQPHAGFDDVELHPDLFSKAAALCFSLIMNHPFVDGNKRVAHAAMEIFLVLNGYQLDVSTDEQESIILSVATGNITQDDFIEWIKRNTCRLS